MCLMSPTLCWFNNRRAPNLLWHKHQHKIWAPGASRCGFPRPSSSCVAHCFCVCVCVWYFDFQDVLPPGHYRIVFHTCDKQQQICWYHSVQSFPSHLVYSWPLNEATFEQEQWKKCYFTVWNRDMGSSCESPTCSKKTTTTKKAHHRRARVISSQTLNENPD